MLPNGGGHSQVVNPFLVTIQQYCLYPISKLTCRGYNKKIAAPDDISTSAIVTRITFLHLDAWVDAKNFKQISEDYFTPRFLKL